MMFAETKRLILSGASLVMLRISFLFSRSGGLAGSLSAELDENLGGLPEIYRVLGGCR